MKGDFSRDSFEASKHFLRVLMQQGRVQLDADWNEQVAILLHYMQTLAKDLIGAHAGPGEHDFEIELVNNGADFKLKRGHYYVDGILCEHDEGVLYSDQEDYPLPDDKKLAALADGNHLVYLDVWERHLNYVEAPRILEVALNGADTATRSKVVCQVKTMKIADTARCSIINTLKGVWQPPNRGSLKARAQEAATKASEPCVISPSSQYRGLENQLYRVEIHRGGAANAATFKWSRDNGAVIFPITKLTAGGDNTVVTVKHLGRDERYGLHKGDWVEIIDDDYTLQNRAETLLQVLNIDPITFEVTLAGTHASTFGNNAAKHAFLRRWDQRQQSANKASQDFSEGACLVKEETWLTLEDGVQIWFTSAVSPSHTYRTGDYWLIPARTTTGDVIWPQIDASGKLEPEPQPPHGVEHHYAPLGIIEIAANKFVAPIVADCRCRFEVWRECPPGGKLSSVAEVASDAPEILEAAPASKTKVRPKAQPKSGT